MELKKNLGLWGAIFLIIGSVIGAGVFFKPYVIYKATGGAPGMGILSWLFGGIISIFGALSFAEIAVLIPKTGGMVAYLSEVYSEKIGFLAGWMQSVIFYPAFIAGYAIAIGRELSYYLGNKSLFPVALLFIILLVALNISASKNVFKIQGLFTISKVVLLFIFIIFGFLKGDNETNILTPLISLDKDPITALGATSLSVLFAFEGWTNIGAIAGEMKNPKKDLSKAIIIGVSLIMVIYLLLNISYLFVIPADELMLSEAPASKVALRLFGEMGETIIKGGIILSVIGAGNGFLITGSRVLYSLPFPLFNKLDKNQVPKNALVLIGILASFYAAFGKFDFLTDLATFSSWIFYTLTFCSVISFRKKKPYLDRVYKVPLYPFIPILAILSGVYVIINQIFLSGASSRNLAFLSVGITLLGLPFYYLTQKNKRRIIAFYLKDFKKPSSLLKNSKDNDVL